MRIITIALLLAAVPAGAQEAPRDRAWREMSTASIADLAARISVVDEPMDTAVIVSSQPIYRKAPRLMETAEPDQYLRALIDRRTGNTLYQFIYTVRYVGRYEAVTSANYLTAEGPQRGDVRELTNETIGCGAYGCDRRITIAVNVPRAVLDWATHRAGSPDDNIWWVRLISLHDAGNRGMHPNEIAALLARVDQVASAMPHRP